MILVMRHAEKPADPNDANLAPAGQTRAAALADYIPRAFGAPDFIFAAAASIRSDRPLQTVQPLAQRINVTVDASIADIDYQKLADRLLTHGRYANKRILMCWRHGHIPALMQALGAPSGTFPDRWDLAVFDLILKMEFGDQVTVTKVKEPF
ncbi:histidine phosphatase family protein [Methylovirgula sp. 4M-Z18]|nr:histidine phosphatase family protein [Methylovirgula sp. 4M-Z18]